MKIRLTDMVTELLETRLAGRVGSVFILVCLILPSMSSAVQPGESEFNTTCIACHTIGDGRRVGPDLAGIADKRSDDWLFSFIKSSQAMIDSGDADAVAIAEEYQGLLMPDTMMSDDQLWDIVSYLKGSDGEAAAAEPAAEVAEAAVAEPASEEDILTGQQLFQGETRFANGGAACNACHDVRNDAVIGGGILAAELTTVFSKMGREGVTAILGKSPFPVMQAACEEKELTEGEVRALVAFLEFADSEEYNQLPRDYGIGLFLSGTVGAGILFAIFGITWRDRKVGSVNKAIYDRQIESRIDGS